MGISVWRFQVSPLCMSGGQSLKSGWPGEEQKAPSWVHRCEHLALLDRVASKDVATFSASEGEFLIFPSTKPCFSLERREEKRFWPWKWEVVIVRSGERVKTKAMPRMICESFCLCNSLYLYKGPPSPAGSVGWFLTLPVFGREGRLCVHSVNVLPCAGGMDFFICFSPPPKRDFSCLGLNCMSRLDGSRILFSCRLGSRFSFPSLRPT